MGKGLIVEAIDEGYTHMRCDQWPAAQEQDGAMCAKMHCDCGKVGMHYCPMWRNGSYRAFAQCPVCKREIEF